MQKAIRIPNIEGWVCVAHGRWTRGVDIEDDTNLPHQFIMKTANTFYWTFIDTLIYNVATTIAQIVATLNTRV